MCHVLEVVGAQPMPHRGVLPLLRKCCPTGIEVVKAAPDLLLKSVREQEQGVRKAERIKFLNWDRSLAIQD
jgi:hypothetical protein